MNPSASTPASSSPQRKIISTTPLDEKVRVVQTTAPQSQSSASSNTSQVPIVPVEGSHPSSSTIGKRTSRDESPSHHAAKRPILELQPALPATEKIIKVEPQHSLPLSEKTAKVEDVQAYVYVVLAHLSLHSSSLTTIPNGRGERINHIAELALYIRLNKGCKVPYDTLPFAILDRKDKLDYIPINTHRYTFRHSTNYWNNEVAPVDAVDQICKQVSEWLHEPDKEDENDAPFGVNVYEIGTTRVVDIHWPGTPSLRDLEKMREPITLEIDDTPLVHSGSGYFGDPNLITIYTTLTPVADLVYFKSEFEKKIPRCVKVIDIWRLRVIPSIYHTKNSEWKGAIAMLVSLHDPINWPKAALEPRYTASCLPGHIAFGDRSCFLQYADRRPWCGHCREKATKFHIREDCAHAPCKKCEANKHTQGDCPLNVGKAMVKQEAADPTTSYVTYCPPPRLPIT